jgi:hypothetical protein
MTQNSSSYNNFVQISDSRAADGERLVPSILPVAGAGNYRIARGQIANVTAQDTIVTGLATVISAVACMEDAPVAGCEVVNAGVGDQSSAPAAGSIYLNSWKTLGGTPAAATTFSLKVNWIAIGT